MATTNRDPSCTSLMSRAERELGAFMSAVNELYGPEQARISAGDWIDELESIDGLLAVTSREWRLITIAAAARLASRLSKAGRRASALDRMAFC